MRPTKASVTQTWLLYTQLCLLKDLIIRCVRQFIRRAKSMLLSQNVVADSAEISVIDVKSNLSVGKDPSNFEIAEIRIHDSVCIEIPSSEETTLLGSVCVWVLFLFSFCNLNFATFDFLRLCAILDSSMNSKLGFDWIRLIKSYPLIIKLACLVMDFEFGFSIIASILNNGQFCIKT